MPNQIEARGIEILKKKLAKQGRKVLKSDNKTFDLIVDGKYAEVKTKKKPYDKLDFLSFTDNQHKEIMQDSFEIFLVCNVGNPSKAEIYKFKSTSLKKFCPKKYTSYEYNKSLMDNIIKYGK